MDTKNLMAGIAVVIDDALGDPDEGEDLIGAIVGWFETEWELPFVRSSTLPKRAVWPNLLRAASFVLLDWRLWGSAGDMAKEAVVEEIKEFLISARESLVPVFILTNESPDDVTAELDQLPDEVYAEPTSGTNFVFVEQKSGFWSGDTVDVGKLQEWVFGNASVYALKTWEYVLEGAKAELFRAMCGRNVDWPRVFWDAYVTDRAQPSASLTNLINDSLCGRMQMDGFEEAHLKGDYGSVSDSDLRGLIAEASFRSAKALPKEEVRCGDLFEGETRKYWLNVRPDCDCIPRDGRDVGDVDIYCVEGKRLKRGELRRLFKNGHFEERVSQSVVFGVHNGRSILFDFGKFRVCKYAELRDKRLGRLLHPYITRVQQRHALYMQRQALPRVPEAAVAGG